MDDLSFEVEQGEVFGLLGPNEAGKTTTIRMILDILSIPAALWFGAKLFRVGLLIYGKRPTLREIGRILRS